MNWEAHDIAAHREAYERGLIAGVNGWSAEAGPMVGGYPHEDLSSVTSFMLTGDAKEKRKWCSVLPKMANVRSLWVKTTVNQHLFDVICGLPRLERVDFWGTSITQCSALQHAPVLTELSLMSAPRLLSIGPISALKRLRALSLEGNFRYISDLASLEELTSLQGLQLGGLQTRQQKYASLRPMTALSELTYLRMYRVIIDDGDLTPLEELPKLEYLFIDEGMLKHWTRRAFQRLHEALPRLRNRTVERAATDAAFRRTHGISD